MIYLGADHRGYNLKEGIKKFLNQEKIKFKDLGNLEYDENDDYPDFAAKVAQKVSSNPEKDKGILVCGTGIGTSIVANKFKAIRAGLCLSSYMAEKAKQANDINVLCLAADITDLITAEKIIKVWLKASFSKEERHKRRLRKIAELLNC